MTAFWLIAAVAFLVAEALTVGLVTVWFALGAFVAALLAFLGAGVVTQSVVFVVVSAAVLALVRPYVVKFTKSKKKATNADRVIGMVCAVTEDIDNIAGKGAVAVDGKVWTARTSNGDKLPQGTYVRVLAIQGVKLIVEAAGEQNKPQKNEEVIV